LFAAAVGDFAGGEDALEEAFAVALNRAGDAVNFYGVDTGAYQHNGPSIWFFRVGILLPCLLSMWNAYLNEEPGPTSPLRVLRRISPIPMLASKPDTEIAMTKAADLKRKLERVLQVGLSLARSDDLQHIVQLATNAGRELCGAQFGAFFYNVTDASGESFRLYTLSGADPEDFDKFPQPRNTQVFGPTFEGRSSVRSGDIKKDPRYGQNSPYYGMPKGHLPVSSFLSVPVKTQTGETLGGLFFGHEKADVFDQESEDLIFAIAAQAAVAIENARLREDLN